MQFAASACVAAVRCEDRHKTKAFRTGLGSEHVPLHFLFLCLICGERAAKHDRTGYASSRSVKCMISPLADTSRGCRFVQLFYGASFFAVCRSRPLVFAVVEDLGARPLLIAAAQT